MTLKEISFDNDDKNLFLVDDLKLKAEAIRYSILPKLEIITNETISQIEKIYITDVLSFSTVVKFPSFRKTRTTEFKIDYTSAEAGLGARRDKALWITVLNKSGKQPMILPFSISYRLDEEGLFFYFTTTRFNLKLNNYNLFYEFHKNYAEEIYSLSNEAKTFLQKVEDDEDFEISPLTPMSEYLEWQIEKGFWDLPYFSRIIKYPISSDEIEDLVEDFCSFYPLYENYLKLACGESIEFKEDIQFLADWKMFGDLTDKEEGGNDKEEDGNDKEEDGNENKNEKTTGTQDIIEMDFSELKKLAESRVRVMPALRWLVFSRDDWRCVACGKSSEDGRLLQVDHIIPRSKGGLDHLENYQTLCSECNIGKSNRDQTDLRNRNDKV